VKNLRSKVVILAILASAMFVQGKPVLAASSISYRGIALTPAIEQLTIRPGQNSVSYKIRVDNTLGASTALSVSSLDFKSLNDTGGLAFIGNNAGQLQHKYGLANWLSLPTNPIEIAPGGGQFIDITIQNRSDLSPGGHYAAVLFRVGNSGDVDSNKVQLDQVVSSLLFVRKLGGETYSLNLEKIDFNNSLFSWPTAANIYLANTGNTQTAPRGTLSLNGRINILNQDSNLVLPGSTRVYNVALANSKRPIWPGIYHTNISYRPDGVDGFKSVQTSIIYINPWFVLAILLLILVFLAARPRFRRRLVKRFKKGFKFTRRCVRAVRLFIKIYSRIYYRRLKKKFIRAKPISMKVPAIRLPVIEKTIPKKEPETMDSTTKPSKKIRLSKPSAKTRAKKPVPKKKRIEFVEPRR